jgi:glutathione S-transferase
MTNVWETEIEHPWMQGALNLAQLTLVCALGLEARIPDFRWRPAHPRLGAWFERVAARPSFQATAPPASS